MTDPLHKEGTAPRAITPLEAAVIRAEMLLDKVPDVEPGDVKFALVAINRATLRELLNGLSEEQRRIACARLALWWLAGNVDPSLPAWAKDIARSGLAHASVAGAPDPFYAVTADERAAIIGEDIREESPE